MSGGLSVRRRRLLVVEWLIFVVAYAQIVSFGATYALAAFGNIVYLAVGTLLVVRLPNNPIGSMMTVAGWGWTLLVSADVAAERLADAGSVQLAGWVALVAMLCTAPLVWVSVVAIWLIVPDGRPATPTAGRLLRWSAWFLVVPTAVGIFATPRVLGPGVEPAPHPFVEPDVADVAQAVWGVCVFAYFVLTLVAVALLLLRLRNAGSVERRQILVLSAGLVVYVVVLVVGGVVQPAEGDTDRSHLVSDGVASILLAITLGVAIGRYRLFELGRVVRRSVVYAGLAVMIAAIYVAVVVGVGAYYGDDADLVLSIVATVVVALVFQPARRGLERWANRLVYGRLAEPHEVLGQFARLSIELPDEELLTRVPELVARGTSARATALWEATDDGFRIVASWPDEPDDPTTPVGTVPDTFDPSGADLAVRVDHQGELLGWVSVVKEPGESVTDTERTLLDDLAGALGVAMNNAGLAADLRRELTALEASRERLLSAGDDARRSLEWALDSGPQQRLVALKVKLGPARVRAERLGADRVAALLAALEPETDLAIQSIRRFAAGVYPPELESGGLAPAIRSRAAGLPFAMSVRIRGGEHRRFDREIEAAVYLAVLEALQNASKHARARTVDVLIDVCPGELSFEVVDDGVGFDTSDDDTVGGDGEGLAGMTERLAAVGGRLDVVSAVGAGTRVVGSVPLRQGAESSPTTARSHESASASMPNDDFGMNASAPAASAGAAKSPDSWVDSTNT